IRYTQTAGKQNSERDRALVEEAMKVDPLSPLLWVQICHRHHNAGRVREANEAAQRVLDLTSVGNPARVYAGYYLALLERREEAIRVLDAESAALKGSPYGSIALFCSRALKGDSAGAVQAVTPHLEKAAHWGEDLALGLADGYALIGHRDQALRWLRAAVDRGLFDYPNLAKFDPF